MFDADTLAVLLENDYYVLSWNSISNVMAGWILLFLYTAMM